MNSPHFLSGQKIIIAGAGIAGLSFARALRRQWPSSLDPPVLAIYERDTRKHVIGREGYSMSIRSDAPGGIQALQKLGILERMIKDAVSTADHAGEAGFCIWDKNFSEVAKLRSQPPPGLPVGGLRIARSKLRHGLVTATLEVGCDITWDVVCTGVQRQQDGRLEVHLSDGTTQSCDLFVVADGASSKIRGQLRPHDKLVFRHICCIGATSRFEDKPPEPVHRDWGMVLSGTGTGLFVSPVDERSALWSLSFPSDEPRVTKRKPLLQTAEAKDLLAEARTYIPEFPVLFEQLVNATDTSTIMAYSARDKEPFRHTDADFPDVVFLGDANHAVTPFAGNGAGMALHDGWDLAELLCISSSLQEALAEYDRLVEPRSRKVLRQSHFSMSLAHVKGLKMWLYVFVIRVMAWLFLRRSPMLTSNREATRD